MRRLTVTVMLLVLAVFPVAATWSGPAPGSGPSPTLLFVDGPLAGYEPAQIIALVAFVGLGAVIGRKRFPLT